jgi:lipopolysaccharide cholinephosphotransferase
MGLRFLCGTANVHTGIRTSRPKWEQLLLRIVRALRLYRLIDIKDVYRRMDRLFQAQDAEHAEYAGTLTGAYKTKEIVPRKYFGDTYDEYSLWEFEGMLLRGPKCCDEYLTHMFGDYMELPPAEERKIHYKPCIRYSTPEE